MLNTLCRLAYECVRDVVRYEYGGDAGLPGMVATVQTFGDLIHWHPHVHAIVSEGVFMKDGTFVSMPDVDLDKCVARWQKKVFALLVREKKIELDVVASMNKWAHSGFAIHNSVRVAEDDSKGMQRLAEYIVRCPFSLARIIKVMAPKAPPAVSSAGRCSV